MNAPEVVDAAVMFEDRDDAVQLLHIRERPIATTPNSFHEGRAQTRCQRGGIVRLALDTFEAGRAK